MEDGMYEPKRALTPQETREILADVFRCEECDAPLSLTRCICGEDVTIGHTWECQRDPAWEHINCRDSPMGYTHTIN